jgi:hypothetical protein
MKHRLPLVAAILLLAPVLARAELCRYAGTTSRGGQVAATTNVTQAGDELRVDVALTFRIDAWLSDVQILWEEVSTWRRGELQSLGVNGRTVIDGEAKKQQWDVFLRDGTALHAYRVQAKRLADFRQRHPGFVRHWSPASFGQPWMQDYMAAPAERRPDLDLPGAPPGVRTPLAFAFYWSRFLPSSGGAAPVFLPGFKRDARSDVAFGPATSGEGWRRWEAPLRHPGLERRPASIAAAWISPDNYLLQLGFDVHASLASGQALIRTQGCQGVQIRPDA